MKKFVERILGIILILVLGYQQFCYADMIDTPSTAELLFEPITFLVCLIGVIILIISAISFFSLKATVKKQNMVEHDSNKSKTLSSEEIEKKKHKIQRRLYVWGMILAIIGLIYLGLAGEISVVAFFIPIILFIISIIVRLSKNKKVSNIICAISIVFICLMGLSNKMIESYNEQFLQYEESENQFSAPYVSDVEGLINTAIKNNKSGRKTTFIYQNTNYTSSDELKQLLSKLNTDGRYNIDIEYNNDNDYINNGYINSITLVSYINGAVMDTFYRYEGKRLGSGVIGLTWSIEDIVSRGARNIDINMNIIYISEIGQKTTININTEDDLKNIRNLRREIKYGRTYNVEVQLNYPNDSLDIIITTNN